MRRRALLALLAAGVAGCTADDGGRGTPTDRTPSPSPDSERSPSPSSSPSPTATDADQCYGPVASGVERLSVGETYTTEEGVDVQLSVARVAESLFTGHMTGELLARDGWQYLGLRYAVDGDLPDLNLPWESDSRWIGNDAMRPWVECEPLGNVNWRVTDTSYRVTYLPFPARRVESAAAVWWRDTGPRIAWELDDETLDRLAVAPDFVVERYEVYDGPDEHDQEADVEVTNVGDRDGRFRGLVRDPYSGSTVVARVAFDVPAGENRTETISPAVADDWLDETVLYTEDGTVEPTVHRTTATPTPTGTATR